MTSLRVLSSEQDASVNFVMEAPDGGFFEARYVRRSADYFVCYLSSHSGCNRGCSFCHLTATKQTQFKEAWLADYLEQARQVLVYARQQPGLAPGGHVRAKYMHYAFMARGEPLVNGTVLMGGSELLRRLGEMAHDLLALPAKFCVSTIMPRTLRMPLAHVFGYITPTIYYSLYSVDPEWRAAHMPGAMSVSEALRHLGEYQQFSKRVIKIHGAFIEGENDSPDQVVRLLQELRRGREKHGLRYVEFNVVRFNPPAGSPRRESSRLQAVVHALRSSELLEDVKLVERVGYDVNASCGMFVEPKILKDESPSRGYSALYY